MKDCKTSVENILSILDDLASLQFGSFSSLNNAPLLKLHAPVHLDPRNMALFGNEVFVDEIRISK